MSNIGCSSKTALQVVSALHLSAFPSLPFRLLLTTTHFCGIIRFSNQLFLIRPQICVVYHIITPQIYVVKYFLKSVMRFLLKERRKALGLTQLQVAQMVGLAESAYQRYEYGKNEPSVGLAIRIAHALDSTVEELFLIDEE